MLFHDLPNLICFLLPAILRSKVLCCSFDFSHVKLAADAISEQDVYGTIQQNLKIKAVICLRVKHLFILKLSATVLLCASCIHTHCILCQTLTWSFSWFFMICSTSHGMGMLTETLNTELAIKVGKKCTELNNNFKFYLIACLFFQLTERNIDFNSAIILP